MKRESERAAEFGNIKFKEQMKMEIERERKIR